MPASTLPIPTDSAVPALALTSSSTLLAAVEPAASWTGGAPDVAALAELADHVAVDGVEAHETAVADVAAAARAAGVCPALIDALVTPTGSPILRARAFGRVALALATATGTR